MEKTIITNWEQNKNKLKEYFKKNKQEDFAYEWNDFIKCIIKYALPDFNLVDYKTSGDYQGEIYIKIEDKDKNVYKGKTYYGSCSFCDSLTGICDYNYDRKPNKSEVFQYMELSLQIIESFKKYKVGVENE